LRDLLSQYALVENWQSVISAHAVRMTECWLGGLAGRCVGYTERGFRSVFGRFARS
jgi:hypothetical protein